MCFHGSLIWEQVTLPSPWSVGIRWPVTLLFLSAHTNPLSIPLSFPKEENLFPTVCSTAESEALWIMEYATSLLFSALNSWPNIVFLSRRTHNRQAPVTHSSRISSPHWLLFIDSWNTVKCLSVSSLRLDEHSPPCRFWRGSRDYTEFAIEGFRYEAKK